MINGTSGLARDAPTEPLSGFQSGTVAFPAVTSSSFVMWLFYNPAPVGGGIWVPVASVPWSWSATASFNASVVSSK
jgi:hypothetical protein